MSGRPRHVPGARNHDTRRYIPARLPSFADYDRIPLLPSPPTYSLPPAIHRRIVRMGARLWEVSSPNSYRHAFCPGLRPDNLNLTVNFFEESNRRYDGHMGPFDPTRNTQLCLPGKEWRALIVTPAAGDPRDSPEFESASNCWESDRPPAIDTGKIHSNYIDRLIRVNQETERRIEALHQVYLNLYFFDDKQRALWSSSIRPTFPVSEQIDILRRLKRYSEAVDRITEVQQGIKDKRAFIDYVARLHESRFWMPDPGAEVDIADDRYLGVWLNGTKERTARWYLKEGIPCFIMREIPPSEHVQFAAQESMIDFAAGTTSSSIHWNVNEYDVRALARGDLTIAGTSRTFDPGWIWPTLQIDEGLSSPQETKGKNPNDYKAPPLVSVVVDKDKVPWIKPPPVKRAEASRPGAPAIEKKKWRKFIEKHHPEGTFREVGAKNNPDHRTHSWYDRERRWHIFFLQAPKRPPGCISDVRIYGQPCPEGVYCDLDKVQLRQPMWIYDSRDPRPTDVGREALRPRPEELPSLRDPPPPPSSYHSESDDDHYPDFDDQGSSSKIMRAEGSSSTESAKIMPAALIAETRPAACGATGDSESSSKESLQTSSVPLRTPAGKEKADEEVSLGDEDSVEEAMGPQIPINFMVDDLVDVSMEMAPTRSESLPGVRDTTPEDPLEFASSYLTLYGMPLSEDFTSVQTLVIDLATRLQLPIRRIFRTTVGQGQSFWFETGSISQARQLRNYMHHRQENGVELLVSFVNYENYLRALRQSTHTWPNSSVLYPVVNTNSQSDLLSSSSSVPPSLPVASSSIRRSSSREQRFRRYRRSSRSPEHYRLGRRSPSKSRRRSPERPSYPRRRHQRSPLPCFRDRACYQRSLSPRRQAPSSGQRTPSVGSVLPTAQNPSSTVNDLPPPVPLPLSALPVLPNVPAAINLSPDVPLPLGANIAFMWSPSGNTLSPVLLQGNATVIPYPFPPSGPTPSALLPWPVAAALPPLTATSSSAMSGNASADPTNAGRSLAVRISDRLATLPASPRPENSHPSLMSRMTSDLANRLSNPSTANPLSSRLSNPPHIPLANRLRDNDPMEVDPPSYMDPREFEVAHLAAISDMMATAGPLVLDPVQYDYPNTAHSDQEEEEIEDQMEDIVEYKRTKQGKRAGRRIQNIRKRDDERRGRGRGRR